MTYDAYDENVQDISCQIKINLKKLSDFNHNIDLTISPMPIIVAPACPESTFTDLWPEHSFQVQKSDREFQENEALAGEEEQFNDLEQEQSLDDGRHYEQTQRESFEEQSDEAEHSRVKKVAIVNKLKPSKWPRKKAAKTGLPTMTLDTLIARGNFSEADVKKIIGKNKNPYANSDDPWLKPAAFTCNKCGQKFEDEVAFREHSNTCVESTVKCTKCDQDFKSVEELNEHMESMHDELVWACKFCSDKFSRKKFLMQHVRTVHDERKFQCSMCPKKFESAENLEIHEKSHDKKKRIPCAICNKTYSSATALRTHMELHTMTEKPFKCEKCGSAFYNKHQLKSHVKKVHEPPSTCKICHAPLRGAPAVIRKHMMNVHGEKYMYQCKECDKQFEDLYELNAHKKSHTATIQCNICGKIFSQKRNYTQHMNIHAGVPKYDCPQCDRKFLTNCARSKHVKSVHSDAKNFHCDTCGKSFKSVDVLRHHKEIHENERKYTCKLCGKAFNSPGSIWKHRAVHERQGVKNVGMYCSARLSKDPDPDS